MSMGDDLTSIRDRLWALHLRGMAAAAEGAAEARPAPWRPPLEGEAAVRARKRCEEGMVQVAKDSAQAWLRGEVPELVICGPAIVPGERAAL